MASVNIKEILKLSVPDRIELVEAIWDSIVENPAALSVTEAQKQELDRRLSEYRADPSAGKSWDEVRGTLDPGQ